MADEASTSAAPPPRERDRVIGQDAAVAELRAAAASDRLHHAWLLGGPAGIGKATLAFRFARRLLAPPAEHSAGGDGLGIVASGRTARQVAAGSHPNLIVLERVSPDGEKAAPRTISVEAVRKVLAFFGATAANGGRRICIVDSVEDLTLPAANALLKTVEEPPAGALILLISHEPQRVLPTIRSRCRKLALRPLSPPDVDEVLGSLGAEFEALDPGLRRRAAAASDGSVARALALLDSKRLALLDEIDRLLDGLPDPPVSRVLALAETLADRRHEEAFGLALDAILRWLAARVEALQAGGPRRLAPLADVCEKIVEAARSVEVYNLDRRAFVVSTFGDLADAVRRTA